MGLFAARFMSRPRKLLKVEIVQFAAGLPRRNCTKEKNKTTTESNKSNGSKQRSGQAKRSTLFPEGRGQGVGGKKKKTKKEKEVELNTCGKAFEEDFGNMEVLIKEEEVCDFPGGDAS